MLNTNSNYKNEFVQDMRRKRMRVCYVCGKTGNLHKHHIIHGHGKRKACETKESLIDICFDCHRLVHSANGSDLDMRLKATLQATYLKKGYTEENMCKLMGGKLLSCNRELTTERV